MNELKINGFSAVAKDELMNVDGGGFWKGFFTILGTVGSVAALFIPGGAAITVATVSTAVTAGATSGYGVGSIVEDAFNN